MTTERLQEFVILAQTLSFTKASESLYISQSVLSKHIAEMEKELSVKLFYRTTHGVSLTDEGRLLFRGSFDILGMAESTTALLSVQGSHTAGKIKLNCHEQTLCAPVLSFIKKFRNKYDQIDIDVHVIHSAPDLSAIQDADILLSPCDFMDRLTDSYKGAHIFTQNALLAIPPRHHLGDLNEISLKNLENENLLVPFSNELFGPYSRNYFLAARKARGVVKKIPVASPEDAILKVELGDGVMILPHHLKNHLYHRTRFLKITDEECVFPVYIYTRRSKNSNAVSLFFDSISSK